MSLQARLAANLAPASGPSRWMDVEALIDGGEHLIEPEDHDDLDNVMRTARDDRPELA
ncbi:MAG: hypothetical protein JO289_25185 [Xanthobacteraceae bacterium]|nr:hypothetical protein [Xanthobacteraceae bacterium]